MSSMLMRRIINLTIIVLCIMWTRQAIIEEPMDSFLLIGFPIVMALMVYHIKYKRR